MKPVTTSERIQILDALRGFALLGILIVNFMIISWPSLWLDMLDQTYWTAPADRLAQWIVHFFFENKFFSLFSFLFGVGFAVQWFKAQEGGSNFSGYYLRRQLILLGIGALHAWLLWPGDFLVLYALQGMLLLLFRNCRERTLLIWAGIFFAVPVLLTAAFYFAAQADPAMMVRLQNDFSSVILPDLLQHINKSWTLYPNGTFSQTTAQRLNDTARFYASMPFWFWNSFAMFLVGLYAGKRRIFQNLGQHKGLIRRILYVCGPLGLIANFYFVQTQTSANVYVPNAAMLWNAVLFPLSNPTMTLFYMALFCTFREVAIFQKFMQALAPMGKIALTNYISQSLICNLLLFSFGLGLYGRISPFYGLLVCLGIYLAQLLFSYWWTQHWRFGPVEWIWRRLTYGRTVKGSDA